jgi:HlyD family secretion protein
MTQTAESSAVKKKAKRPRVVRIIGMILLIAVVSFLWWRFGPMAKRNAREGLIVATGTIEATEVVVSSEIGGYIDRLLVDEGDRVERQQVVAEIEDSRTRAEVQRAEAALETARATLDDLRAGARSEELDRARARVELARATLSLAEADWKRMAELFAEGVVSENQRDSARANLDVARGQHDAAREELKLLEAGARPDQIEAARWQVEQAEAALRSAQVVQEKMKLHAPIGGVVLDKDSEEGEFVSPGVPVVTLADLDDMWVKIYIGETDIGKVRVGQRAATRVDSFPERDFSGTITYISDEAEFTPKNIQTREDRVKLVFAVKVGIDNAGGLLKPGMYADIEIEALTPDS